MTGDTRDRTKPLPRSLRADTVVKNPLACRFGWHHWHWRKANSYEQYGDCIRCGRTKRKFMW